MTYIKNNFPPLTLLARLHPLNPSFLSAAMSTANHTVPESLPEPFYMVFFNEQLLRISNLYSVWSQIITHFKIFLTHFRIFPKHFC